MEFTFNITATVSVSVERTEGKFASRDEIGDQIQEALESEVQQAIEAADPGSYEGENGGQYETSEWSVDCTIEQEQPQSKRGRAGAR